MGQWRRNIHWEELHYMLISCKRSFWYCSEITLKKMFKVFSSTPKFLTKTRELKEWFLKPEVKWDGPYWAEGTWWSLPGQQQRERHHHGISWDPILIPHDRYAEEMPILWPVTLSTTSCQHLNLFVGLEHFRWGIMCANNLLKQWHHEFTLAIHLSMSFPCRINQREDNLLYFSLDLLFQHSHCVTKKWFYCKCQCLRVSAGWTSQRDLASVIWAPLSVLWPLTLAVPYPENWITVCMNDWTYYHG